MRDEGKSCGCLVVLVVCQDLYGLCSFGRRLPSVTLLRKDRLENSPPPGPWQTRKSSFALFLGYRIVAVIERMKQEHLTSILEKKKYCKCFCAVYLRDKTCEAKVILMF